MRRLIVSGFLLASLPLYAAPGIMNYQAKLTDSGGSPITTMVNVTFTFRDAASGGNLLGGGFSDTDMVTPDSKGIVSTDIGDDPSNLIPASVFASDSVWLNVNVGGTDITPRSRISSSGYALNALSIFGPAYEIVEVTASPAINGTNLMAAYNRAKALVPHGQPLGPTNHATVLVPPGKYDMGTTSVVLDIEFVDLVGLSSKRDDQYIFGQTNGTNTGVLRQTANNVGIENLVVQSTLSVGTLSTGDSDPAAYFPDSDMSNTSIRNCEFRDDGTSHSWSMRVGITYSGRYENCAAGDDAFGGGGAASGIFINCTGNAVAFGGGGTASGTFKSCTGGAQAFGGVGTASGTFSSCTGGESAFGGGFFGWAAGTFTNCVAGDDAFGGGLSGDTSGGRLLGCRMTGTTWEATFVGRMENCFWGTGFTCDANARIYGTTIAGTLDLNSTAAGVTGTRAQDITNEGSNIFGGTSAAALNIENAGVN